ncbi:ImmA/IrrE family metallo-endopeptidase, partial [Patescibacteria group bacterium]|nr:ImmA/IrrE family metallo-endopeptidase [Patescibacteria group bacterium]
MKGYCLKICSFSFGESLQVHSVNSVIISLLNSASDRIFCSKQQHKIPTVPVCSILYSSHISFILLNDNPKISEERKIFSVMHELGHLIFHRGEYAKG